MGIKGFVIGLLTATAISLGAAQIGPRPPSGGGGTTIPTTARLPFTVACPTGWTPDTTINGLMLLGTTAAAGDVGTTGGSNDLTPAGTNSTPSFTGNAVASSLVSGGTPAGTVTQPTFTGDSVSSSANSAGTPAGTNGTPIIAWPAGVPTAANESAHTHSVTAAGTNGTSSVTPLGTVAWPAGVPTHSGTTATFTGNALGTHQHELPLHGGTTPRITAGYGTGASIAGTRSLTNAAQTTSQAVLLSQAITAGTPAGSVTITSQGTIAWPAGVPTFSGSSSTVGAQTFTGSGVTSGAGSAHTHTLSWPAGVPTSSTPSFTGSALGTHQHTTTATGTVSQPTFGGNALGTHQHTTTATGSVSTPIFTGDVADNRSAFVRVIWCRVSGAEPSPSAGAGTFPEAPSSPWTIALCALGGLGAGVLLRKLK